MRDGAASAVGGGEVHDTLGAVLRTDLVEIQPVDGRSQGVPEGGPEQGPRTRLRKSCCSARPHMAPAVALTKTSPTAPPDA